MRTVEMKMLRRTLGLARMDRRRVKADQFQGKVRDAEEMAGTHDEERRGLCGEKEEEAGGWAVKEREAGEDGWTV